MDSSARTWSRHARLCAALIATLALAGCAPDQDARITELMPLSPAVAELHGQLADDARSDDAFAAEFAGRVRMRAIECTRGRRFEWWTTEADLRDALVPERECFDAADQALLRWLQRRQVGLVLAQPALRPTPAATVPVLVGRNHEGGAVRHVAFARDAGVAAVVFERMVGLFDTADGSAIAATRVEGAGPVALSPNGRVAAIGLQETLQLRGIEGGDFGILAGVAQGQGWWLSDAVLAYNDARDDTLRVVDFEHASESRTPALTGMHGVMAMRDWPGRVLALSRQGAAMVVVPPEGSRYGPTVSIAPLPGMSMLEGDRAITPEGHVFGLAEGGVLQATRDGSVPHQLKLQGTLRQIELGGLPLQGLQPSSDADQLLLALPGKYGAHWFAYSLSRREIAALEPQLAASARLEYVPALGRNVVIDGDGVRILGKVRTAAPESLDVLAKRYAADMATYALVDVEPAAPKAAPATAPPMVATAPASVEPSGPRAIVNGREVPVAPVEASGPYAQINGRVIPVPTLASKPRPTPPPTPGPAKKGREALVDGLRSGVLRLATEADLDAWKRSYEQHARHGVPREFNERIQHNTKYVITGDYTIPDDLTGSASAVFIIERGAPFPNGEPSHSPLLDINSGACVGWVCRSLSGEE